MDPRDPLAIVFGSISGGNAANVIPTDVVLDGTARMFDHDMWRDMPKMIEKAVGDLVHSAGSPLRNGIQPRVPAHRQRRFRDSHGAEQHSVSSSGPNAEAETHQSLGSEDFAWYLEDIPGALLRLGAPESQAG